jgi:hypothetical protein
MGPSHLLENLMTPKPSLILVFAIGFAFFILAPAFLGISFPGYPLIHWADVLDLLTPMVLIPIYWLLFTDSGEKARSRGLVIAFLVLAAVWTEGQGMHLSANSISNLLGGGLTVVHNLVHFYDEVLSHYVWHIGIVGLSIVLLAKGEEVVPSTGAVRWGIVIPSAVLYGFTYFAAVNEGGTVPFGLPAAILIVVGLWLRRRGDLRGDDLTAFFFYGYVIALVLLAGWFLYWGGFPEFSETGFI